MFAKNLTEYVIGVEQKCRKWLNFVTIWTGFLSKKVFFRHFWTVHSAKWRLKYIFGYFIQTRLTSTKIRLMESQKRQNCEGYMLRDCKLDALISKLSTYLREDLTKWQMVVNVFKNWRKRRNCRNKLIKVIAIKAKFCKKIEVNFPICQR